MANEGGLSVACCPHRNDCATIGAPQLTDSLSFTPREPCPAASPEPSCQAVDLQAPRLYLNRETAWLQFNWRVLEEVLDASNPLLERVKFLSIFATNLDEFFMIRVSGLTRQVTGGVLEAPPDGMTPIEQLAAIRKTLLGHLEQALTCWHQDLAPKLREGGIPVLGTGELGHHQKAWLRRYFAREISRR